MKKPEDLRSHRWFGRESMRTFNHRSRMAQIGFEAEDYRGKPVIAILNTWSDINPCHTHFKQRVEEIKRGVWQAGGVPLDTPTIPLPEPLQKPSPPTYRNLRFPAPRRSPRRTRATRRWRRTPASAWSRWGGRTCARRRFSPTPHSTTP